MDGRSPEESLRQEVASLEVDELLALCYTFQPAIAWMANGVVDVKPLISHSLPLAEFEPAFKSFAAGQTLKVQIRPGARS